MLAKCSAVGLVGLCRFAFALLALTDVDWPLQVGCLFRAHTPYSRRHFVTSETNLGRQKLGEPCIKKPLSYDGASRRPSAQSAVAAAEKEPTPRTVRATRDLNPDRPRDLLTWGRDRRSMSVGTAPVRPARGPREHAPSPLPRRVTRNVVVSPTTVVDAARIQRARMLGELCYTIPGSSLPADKRRAERFATQYLGVTAA